MATTQTTWRGCPTVDGTALREARERAGYTRHALAQAAGVTQHRVRNLEAIIGTRWRQDELVCIAILLQTTPAALCVRDTPDTPAQGFDAQVRALGDAVNQLSPARRAAFMRDVLDAGDRDPAA